MVAQRNSSTFFFNPRGFSSRCGGCLRSHALFLGSPVIVFLGSPSRFYHVVRSLQLCEPVSKLLMCDIEPAQALVARDDQDGKIYLIHDRECGDERLLKIRLGTTVLNQLCLIIQYFFQLLIYIPRKANHLISAFIKHS